MIGLIASVVHADDGKKDERDKLRVLVWNVWRGTNEVNNGPEKALKLIQDTKADICLLQESYDINGDRPQFGSWAAKQLGWNAWQGSSPHLCVITPYKVDKTFFHAAWHGLGTELTDPKGRKLHAFSIWIDYRSPIGDYLMKNPDASNEEVLASESKRSGRLSQVNGILGYLKKQKLLELETPLLVGGDWNCPSHLDWTKETAEKFDFRRALKLPVSSKIVEQGFVDSYRAVYPDPITHPGNTWSPLFRENKGKPLPMNRIDRLYVKQNEKKLHLKPVKATVLPEVLEDNAIPVKERKFPSDHSAVLIEFEWVK